MKVGRVGRPIRDGLKWLRTLQPAGIFHLFMLSRCTIPAARCSCRTFAWITILLVGLGTGLSALHAAAPPRGLNQLRPGPLSVGYLDAIRSGVGTTPQNIAALNYEALDIIALAFTLLNPDGSLDLTYGSADVYRPYLITNAHARSSSVLMSVVGDFMTVTADASLRQTAATNIANALATYGFDGVDFDWEWPNTAAERDNFTAFMQAVYTTLKARSPEYIVMFVQGPGYWLAGTDWAAVRDYSDLCFFIAYDWKNPANGPIRKPGSVQFLGLNGGSIEASAKGAIDYVIAHGYPESKIVAGLPFYSSDNRSWITGSPIWSTNRLGYLNSTDPDAREVNFDGAWWTSPDNVKQKMNALLDPRTTVLAGGRTVRGVGFWEIGHEDLANPELTDAIKAWRAGDRSLGGIEVPAPGNTVVLIDAGAAWRYLDTGVYPTPNWTARTFGDGAWPRGLAPLGYGDGDEATVVRYGTNTTNRHITTWFRHAFALASTSAVRALTLRLLRDDGAVVYLNGAEVFRSNMPTGIITQSTLALSAVPPPDESTFYHTAALDPARLLVGTNVVAVEVHQSATNSTDLSFDLQLLAEAEPAQVVIVPAQSRWRYQDGGAFPGAGWTTRSFSESAWFEGRGRLGYGLDGESTTLLFGTNASNKPITCYFRHVFAVEDPALFGPLQINAQIDDGAVVYLNGTEFFRRNLTNGAITSTTLALTAIGGADETNWIRTNIPGRLLVTGTNILAVEVHQSATNSSDLGFDLELTATLQPELTIIATVTNYLLRWPAGAPGFRVLSTNVLNGAANWPLLTATGRLNGAMFELPVPFDGTRFFRLNAP